MKSYRDNGAVGALLDEYEKAITELSTVLETVTQEQLIAVVDPHTNDLDCRSIQTILTHVVRAGYGYAIVIRKHLGEDLDYVDRKLMDTVPEYQTALMQMFAYNEQLFKEYPNMVLEAHDPNDRINVSWGQQYDVEQLFEHAIVHILRHRRQIERFLLKLTS